MYGLHDFYVWCFLNDIFKFNYYLGDDVIAQALKFDYYFGDDVTVQEQSRTRARTTSAISVLQKIDTPKQMTQLVVSASTRELVQQVSKAYK